MKYPRPTLLVAAATLLSSCTGLSYSERVDPRGPRPVVNHVPTEIAALAQDLEERASLRSSLGSARILVEALEPIGPRKGRHRFAILDEEDLNAVQDTIRYELEMALGNRLNILDPDAVIRASESGAGASGQAGGDGVASLRERLGATHAVVGTFVRNGDLVDIAVRLVDLRDGWIVATAERRIPRFVPRAAVSLGAKATGRQEENGERERRLQRTTAKGALAPLGTSPGEQRGTGQSTGPLGSAPAPQLVLAEPDGGDLGAEALVPGVSASGIPAGATIEFDAGPAAARLGSQGAALRVLQDVGSQKVGTPDGVPTPGNRGEHH